MMTTASAAAAASDTAAAQVALLDAALVDALALGGVSGLVADDALLREQVVAIGTRCDASVLLRLVRRLSPASCAPCDRPRSLGPAAAELGIRIAAFECSVIAPFRKKIWCSINKNAFVLYPIAAAAATAAAESPVLVSIPVSEISAVIFVPSPNSLKQKASYHIVLCNNGVGGRRDLSYEENPGNSVSPTVLSIDSLNSVLAIKSDLDRFNVTLQKTVPKIDTILEILRYSFDAPVTLPDMSLFSSFSGSNTPWGSGSRLGVDGCCWVKGIHSKNEGYLYMLPSAVLFGFKKPVTYVACANIASISISTETSRTFSLHVTPKALRASGSGGDGAGGGGTVEIEIIDRSERDAVVAYFKSRGIPLRPLRMQGDDDDDEEAEPPATRRDAGDAATAAFLELPLNSDDDGDCDADYVADGANGGGLAGDDDELDEEYDSEHQTDDGDSSSESSSEDEDNESDGSEDAEDVGSVPRKRRSSVANSDDDAAGGKYKRRLSMDDDADTSADENEEEVDELNP
ncbi:hypothetical protein HDU84_008151 [Entophlyctis sp. JEL0112]|nr:hypothetical protein HDU84_008151 [Entophlyctis sp. JEL0112]